MTGIFKLLFFLFIGYIIFNLLRFVFYIGKGMQEGKKRFSSFDRNEHQESVHNRSRSRGNEKDVIELDKDQYKVE
jgi:hypothetical protein